jgi:hypothetical protein
MILRGMGVNLITLDPPLNTGEPGCEQALGDLISELRGSIRIDDGGNGGGNGGAAAVARMSVYKSCLDVSGRRASLHRAFYTGNLR